MLKPTKIYVKEFLKAAEAVKIKGAVHITGDAYTKFNNLARFSEGIGFEFNNFKPQPIFDLMQKTAAQLGLTITDKEMFTTFNMGWGFGIIIDKADKDTALDVLEKNNAQPEVIGKIMNTPQVTIKHGSKKLSLM